MDVRFAYLAEDKLYFKSGDAPPRLICEGKMIEHVVALPV